MDDEPSLMTTEVMLARMRDYGLIGVSQTAALIMGGVFATAAVTFTEILRVQDALPVRLSGWLVGACAALQVFDSLVRRSLIEGRPTFHAVPFIGAAGILSMVGFALLAPQTGGADGWRYSGLTLFVAAVLFGRSWGASIADYVEPALQPLYDRHNERTKRRWMIVWPAIVFAIAPFAMAMADKYAGVPLQWPIAGVNLILCGFFLVSMLRAHRYLAGVYAAAYAAHAQKLRTAREPPKRRKAPAVTAKKVRAEA
jgi:hypothetical protein